VTPVVDVASVSDRRAAAALLAHPLRPRLVALAREPVSATELAGRVALSRQRVNYHVRQLARTGLLRRAGQVRKRNLIEQRYQATARAYVLAPEVLGPLSATGHTPEDAFSAARLVSLAGEAQADVVHAIKESAAHGQRLATWSIAADVRFESVEQRQNFTQALQAAVTDVIARFSSPAVSASDTPAPGRPFKLLIASYPSRKQHALEAHTRRDGKKEGSS
jgi:hypothetical protein